ncbi:MAG TPA: SMI1/KNR4 family protein [Fimbriimonadaceae bacterium]|nr:SMI1/KNR4 family protein [Fimbriimonadaceae bacterium]
MRVRGIGPVVTEAAVDSFERQHGVRVPGPLRWFWTTVGNGGIPEPRVIVPIENCPYTTAASVHGLYGIGRDEPYYNFARILDSVSRHKALFGVPIGYDDGGCPFLLQTTGPHSGQIRWMEAEEYSNDCGESYFVARDISEFARMIAAAQESGEHLEDGQG